MIPIKRVLALFTRGRADADLRDDIDAHLDLLASDFERQGLSGADARAAARRAFGGVEPMKETYRDQRGLPFVDALAQDLRYGFRMLRKTPGFSLAVVLSLALGIGANTAIFSLIDALLLKSLPVDKPGELYVLQPAGPEGQGAFSYPGFEALRAENRVFSDVFTFSSEGEKWNVVASGVAELSAGQFVTGNFFSALRVSPAAGRAILATDDDLAAAPVVEVRTVGGPAAMASIVRREIQTIAGDVPIYGIKTAAQQIDAAVVQERVLAALSGFFGLLATLLACVGLYGVMMHAVVQRTSEIGVRVALGATEGRVVRLVLLETLRLVAAGIGLGVPLALASTRVLSTLLYGVTPTDPATITAAIAVLVASAMAAAYLPARRASRVDPMVALRCE